VALFIQVAIDQTQSPRDGIVGVSTAAAPERIGVHHVGKPVLVAGFGKGILRYAPPCGGITVCPHA